jgi:hypothetical protein
VELARFTLRRLAHAGPEAAGVWPGGAAGPGLGAVGGELQAALLGDAAAALGDGPVVVVPPGRLHAVPWTLLPCLRARAVTVAPSAAVWLRARRAEPPTARSVALVRGPGLRSEGGEVLEVAPLYPGAAVLGGGSATARRVLEALDGAWLAHVAAHGTFRADHPLFSALALDDGPLTGHDLERLHRAPYRLVLSSCDSGLAAPAGADELLGLTSALVPLGTAGLLASVVPVNDAATVPFMRAVHEALCAGRTMAQAAYDARRATEGDDPVGVATAAAFVAVGAA